LWLRYRPASQHSRWFQTRFGGGSKRQRRIGIVALARRLLIDLWRLLETGVVPQGVEEGPTSYGAYVPDLPRCIAAGDTRQRYGGCKVKN
jgi:hypothetical protein